MEQVRFPKKRSDGTFCIDVIVSVVTEDPRLLAASIDDWWAKAWAPINQTWTRQWSNGEVQTLSLSNDFLDLPKTVSCIDSELRFRLHGTATAQWWKDWLVSKIIPDLKTRFPEVHEFLEFRDCDSC